MCGICGVFTYNSSNKIDFRVRSVIQRFLFSSGLMYMEPRGKDASGMALLWSDNNSAVVKQPVPVSHFVIDDGRWGEQYTNPVDKDAHYKWLMNTWLRNNKVHLMQALGHVRAKTQGSEYNPHNNHPIIVSSNEVKENQDLTGDLLIGVHNGGIRNDNALFEKHKFNRIGEVDSEIIFHLLYKHRDNFTVEALKEVFDELDGTFSVMAHNPKNPTKVACLRETRTLNAAYIKEIGTVILISEKKYLTAALADYERWRVRESGSSYRYIDDENSEQDLGKIGDFPFITANWYDNSTLDTIEEGVFVLDLEQTTDDNTKIKDLIKVSPMSKPARSTGRSTSYSPYGGVYTGHVNNTQKQITAPVIAQQSPIPLPAAAGAVTNSRSGGVSYVDNRAVSSINDLTDYTESTSKTDELVVVDAEIIEGEDLTLEPIPDAPKDDAEKITYICPYDWNERKARAVITLSNHEIEEGDDIFLTNATSTDMKEKLSGYGIELTTEKSEALLSCMYDLVFPEGYAVGFREGYDEAISYDTEDLGDSDELQKRVAVLEGQLAKAEEHNKTLTDRIANLEIINKRLNDKRQHTTQYVNTLAAMLRYVFAKCNMYDKDGTVNTKKLEVLKECSGVSTKEARIDKILRIKVQK